MRNIVFVGVLLAFLCQGFAVAEKLSLKVCANNKAGVPFYAENAQYAFQASGSWKGKGGKDIYSANGSLRTAKDPNSLIAPYYPPGALLLQRGNGSYEFIGTSRIVSLKKQELVRLVFNDYLRAYGDNKGCLQVEISYSMTGVPGSGVSVPGKRLPDLEIIEVRQDPPGSHVLKTSPIFFTVRVENKGTAPSRSFHISSPYTSRVSVDSLSNGEVVSVRFPMKMMVSGPLGATLRNIVFSVDPDNLVKELNENNNKTKPFNLVLH